MRIRLTIKGVDFYELREALKTGDFDAILNLKPCNTKSSRGFGSRKKA
jgi:hypothetical protein